jgi:hypothetical protein
MTEILIEYSDLKHYSVSKVAEGQPKMSDEIYNQTKDDIQNNGQQMPVIIYDKEIYDGRHRYNIAVELKMPLKAIVVLGREEAKRLADSNNEFRRHMGKSQYAMRAAYAIINSNMKIKDAPEIKNKLVSERLVKNAKKIATQNPALAKEVYNGRKTVEEAMVDLNKKSAKNTNKEEENKGYKDLLQSSYKEEAVKEFEELNNKVGLGKAKVVRDYIYTKNMLLEKIRFLNKEVAANKQIDIDDLVKSIEEKLNPKAKSES